MYLLIKENLYPKSYLSGPKIGINAFIRKGLCAGGLSEGGGGAYTWSDASVKKKVGLSAGDLYSGLTGREKRYFFSNSVIISSKKDHTDTSLSFLSCAAFGTAKGFVYLTTK